MWQLLFNGTARKKNKEKMGIELCRNNVSHDIDHHDHGDNGIGCGIASADKIIVSGSGIRPAAPAR